MTTPPRQSDPILSVLPGVVLFMVIGVLMLALLADNPTTSTTVSDDDSLVEEVTSEATPDVVVEADTTPDVEVTETATDDDEAVVMAFDEAAVAHGEMVFQSTCSACHGFNARGIPGLGKDLVESEFIDSLDEQGFVDFVTEGRPADHPDNTTGVAMPPLGGNPSLTEEDLSAVYQWLRVQTAEARGENVIYAATTGTETTDSTTSDTEATADAGQTAEWQALIPDGSLDLSTVEINPQEIYNLSCAGCHGVNGEGVTGNGPALDLEMSAGDLYEFLAEVVRAGDVDPNVEFPHPRRAVPFTLSDEQLEELVDYVLSLAD